jgi:uncharacterized protein YegJ (DUF2314 family)
MTRHRLAATALLSCLVVMPPIALAADSLGLAPNAPADVEHHADGRAELEAMYTAIAPSIAQARRTYPAARARYLAGLPPHHVFFVTVRLKDGQRNEELVFLLVKKIANGQVSGIIANHIGSVRGYQQGQLLTLPEAEVIDWLISKPDGSEEGNLVGKYLDAHDTNVSR